MRKSSTISVTRSTRNHEEIRARIWRLRSEQVDKQFTALSSTPGTKSNNTKLTNTLKQSHHNAIHVVDMEGVQKNILKVSQTLNGCVKYFNTIPKECIKRVIHIKDRADSKATTRGSMAQIPSKKTPVTTPWSKTMSTSCEKVIDRWPYKWLLTSPPKENWQRQAMMFWHPVKSKSKSRHNLANLSAVAITREIRKHV